SHRTALVGLPVSRLHSPWRLHDPVAAPIEDSSLCRPDRLPRCVLHQDIQSRRTRWLATPTNLTAYSGPPEEERPLVQDQSRLPSGRSALRLVRFDSVPG